MKKFPFLIFLFIISCSVNPAKQKVISDSIKKDSLKKDSVQTTIGYEWNFPNNFHPDSLPVNIKEITHRKDISLLSAGKSAKHPTRRCLPDSGGFIGVYYMFGDPRDTNSIIGLMFVQVQGKGEKWNSDNSDEKFVAVQLESNKIKLWNNIYVGMKMSELEKFVPFNFYDNSVNSAIYNFDRYTLFIDYDKNKIVTRLRVKISCEQTPEWEWSNYHPLRSTLENIKIQNEEKGKGLL